MRKWVWILIFFFVQVQGAWLWNRYEEYKEPYIKVICENEMRFSDIYGRAEKIDVWKDLKGGSLHIKNPLKPEYHLYPSSFQRMKKLEQNKNVLSVSYQRFIQWEQVKEEMGMTFVLWIGIFLFMYCCIKDSIPIMKIRRLRLMDQSVLLIMKSVHTGFLIDSIAAFGIVALCIHLEILNSVPLQICGIIGVTFSFVSMSMELKYIYR